MTDPDAVLDSLLARCETRCTPCGDGEMVWRLWGADTKRPWVVLLHGGSGAWNHWVRTIPALETRYRIVAADLPGCGDSADPPAPADAPSLAAVLSTGLDAVIPDGEGFDLVSFSFGGVLSGLIAHAQAARIRSLTLAGVPVLGLTGTGPANDLVNVPLDMPPAEAAPLYRRNLQKLMVHDPAAVDDLALALHMKNIVRTRLRSRGIARTRVLAESLHGLPCRLTCVFGAQDVTLHPDLAGVRAYLAATHPDAAVHVIPGAGHWVAYEAADAFNALLLDILADA